MSLLPPLDPSLSLAARVLIALLFARALYSKLPRRLEFVGIVAAYRVVPPTWAAPVARLVLLAEAAVVVCLSSGFGAALGAELACVLLCAFALAMAINILRGRVHIECGCFRNDLRQQLTAALVARNVLLALVAAVPLLPHPAMDSLEQMTDGICAGVTLFLLYLIVARLLAGQRSGALLRKRWSS